MERFRILASASVVEDGHVLLLRRAACQEFLPGVWALPCGKIDFGEAPADAAIRELWEEAGLRGRNPRLFGASKFFSRTTGGEVFNVQLNFLVDVSGQSVSLSHEHDDYFWQDLASLDMNPGIDKYNLVILVECRAFVASLELRS